MTLALECFDSDPTIPIFDRAISNDAQEIQKIKSRFSQYEVSISYGLSKEKVLEDLQDAIIEANESGWDGYGAKPADPGACLYAWKFLNQLSSNLPPPEIGVDTDGEIAIDWDYGPRRVISIRVGRDGTLNYGGLVGHTVFHGIEIFHESIPRTISLGIERVIGTPF